MINIEFKPKTWELNVKGHAQHGEEGKDIVCAAVSALFYTLGESLNQSQDIQLESPVIKDENGDGYIKCTPDPEYELNVSYIFGTVLTGMQMAAVRYPEYVSLIISE